MQNAPALPTRELIETKTIVENQHYDFKRELGLSKPGAEGETAKVRFLNDVVAFLNSGPGHLIIGVDDKKTGEFQAYKPHSGNRDDVDQLITQVIQNNIEPVPHKVRVEFIDLDEGYLIDIRIPEHTVQPFMNRLTGGFYERTGSRNRPMSREEVRTRFLPLQDLKKEAETRFRQEGNDLSLHDLAAYNILGGSEVSSRTIYRFGVLPRQYASDLLPFDLSRMSLPVIFGFDGQPIMGGLRGDDGGLVASRTYNDVEDERLFLGNDWYVSGFSQNPIWLSRNGRLSLDVFEQRVKDHLAFLESFYDKEGILGPFAVSVAIDNLDSDEDLRRAFRGRTTVGGSTRILERLTDDLFIKDFITMVRSASIHG